MSEPLSDMLTCVVLAPMDRTIDPALYTTLSERDWSPRVEHDPRMAMAEACLVRRELQLRAAWQLESGQVPGLVIASHPHVDLVDAMRTSMARHVPDIPIWTTNGSQIEPLNEAARTASHTKQSSPPIKEDTEPPALVFHPASDDMVPEPLSRDEVSMLLNDPVIPPEPDEPEHS